jgi:hypothetical protein
MKRGFVKSSPHFFRLIARSLLLFAACLLVAAAFLPAPLEVGANPALTPNPVKSAWFLLWIQELVSYSRLMIYPVLALGGLFLLLPWLPGSTHIHQARWFAREQRGINLLTVLTFGAIVALTVVALFLRGKNWSLSWHL